MSYSIRNEWRTPRWLFDAVVERYGAFDLDVAASPDNALCDEYLTREDNAFNVKWSGRVWCNPPFSGDRQLIHWVSKAVREARLRSVETVMLLPGDWGTRAFALAVANARILLLTPRIKFDPPPGVKPSTPTGPSCLAQIHPGYLGMGAANIDLWDLSDPVPKKGRKP